MYYWYAGVLIEVLFVIHAIRRGHGYGWIPLILFFPLIGCIIYFVMVIVPDMQRSHAYAGAANSFIKTLDPKRDLRRLTEDLQSTESITNKAKLADECLSHGMNDEAIKLYHESLAGEFNDDPQLTFGLACAYHRSRQFDDALTTLSKLGDITRGRLSDEAKLLHAMVLEDSGDIDASLEAYESLVPGFSGPEAKCRYGLLLEQADQTDKAKAVFQDVVRAAKRSPSFYRKMHRKWISLAKKHV